MASARMIGFVALPVVMLATVVRLYVLGHWIAATVLWFVGGAVLSRLYGPLMSDE